MLSKTTQDAQEKCSSKKCIVILQENEINFEFTVFTVYGLNYHLLEMLAIKKNFGYFTFKRLKLLFLILEQYGMPELKANCM